jgi:hypothetical protein
MTSVDLYVAKASNDRLQVWIDAREVLKRTVIHSLGRVVRQIVRDSKTRFQRLSAADILVRVTARFGDMQKDTEAHLKEKMQTMLQNSDGLDSHISDLRELFDISDTAGFPVDEYRKVTMFRESVCAHPLILKVLESFDIEFPHAKRTTYEQITAYLTLHLPNSKHAQLVATRATANLVAATAYAALETESKRMQAELSELKRKRPPRTNRSKKAKQAGKGKIKIEPKTTSATAGGKPNRPATESTANLKYCHNHGYQQSHTSSECKVLSADKKKYTNEMRRAKDPHHPPGGSAKVNGQIVPSKHKTRTANTAHVAQLYEEPDDD